MKRIFILLMTVFSTVYSFGSDFTGKKLKSITWTDGKKTEVAELKYDDTGRISEYYIKGKLQNKYSYTDNTITITEDGDRYDYTIVDGRITNSHAFLDGDYVDIDQIYTYNANSQLVSIVSTEKEKGVSDTYTSTSKWSWDRTNLSSWTGDYYGDTETSQYTYYDDITAEPLICALFGFNPSLHIDDFFEILAIYPYLGSLPKDLFKNVVEHDAEGRDWDYNYSYKQNSEGDIVEATVAYTMHTYVYTFEWDNSSPSTDILTIKDNAQHQSNLQEDVLYNISGQRVSNPTKGLYIRNGKKIIVK